MRWKIGYVDTIPLMGCRKVGDGAVLRCYVYRRSRDLRFDEINITACKCERFEIYLLEKTAEV